FGGGRRAGTQRDMRRDEPRKTAGCARVACCSLPSEEIWGEEVAVARRGARVPSGEARPFWARPPSSEALSSADAPRAKEDCSRGSRAPREAPDPRPRYQCPTTTPRG